MQDTEPFVYLAYLPLAVFLIGAGFMVMQGSIDNAMEFTNIEASGSNVGMAKNFYLLNQGERFGKFESGQLEGLKLDGCELDLPGYIEERPKHKIDDSCDYYEPSQLERRADRRGMRICQECRESFEPKRADAAFCGPACKQRAYRQRVTDNELSACACADSRNKDQPEP
jgi:hypothetical protein